MLSPIHPILYPIVACDLRLRQFYISSRVDADFRKTRSFAKTIDSNLKVSEHNLKPFLNGVSCRRYLIFRDIEITQLLFERKHNPLALFRECLIFVTAVSSHTHNSLVYVQIQSNTCAKWTMRVFLRLD